MITYPEGIDCVWLAADRQGQVAAFVTAGCAPIPAPALCYDALLIEDVENEVSKLPVCSEVRLLVEMKRPDDFLAIAARGIYAYDWRDLHRGSRDAKNVYEPVAVPSSPIHVDNLPDNLRSLAASVLLVSQLFANRLPIDICSEIRCCYPK